MNPPAAPLQLPEAAARRVVLVQAIESADPHARLVGRAEREQVEIEVLEDIGGAAGRELPDPAAFLDRRAVRLLELVRHRNPAVVALEHPPRWQGWAAWGLPALALLVGAAIDRIDNPHQVNLLSPPLLAFLLWNLVVYLLLALGPLLPGRGRTWLPLRGVDDALLSRRAEAATGPVSPREVAARFHARWLSVAGTLETYRWKRVMHTAAAAWAVGIALSIILGGVVREYRVGWESTLLDLHQVHAFLSLLFAPVVALLPVEPFSLEELRRLHFRSTAEVGSGEARRWVALYLGLLTLVVVVPRLLLAVHAGWRRRRAARAVTLDPASADVAAVLGRVYPLRLGLVLVAGEPMGSAVLRQMAAQLHDPAAGAPTGALLRTSRGDDLGWREVAVGAAGPGAGAVERKGRVASLALTLWRRPRRSDPPPAARQEIVLLPALGAADLDAAMPDLQALGRPLLVLLAHGMPPAEEEAAMRVLLRRLPVASRVLALPSSTRTWWHEGALREALGALLPPHGAAGLYRLSQCWVERHQRRFERSMWLLGEELLQAARERVELRSAPVRLQRFVNAAEREHTGKAREEAIALLMERLRERQARTEAELLADHAVAAASAGPAPPAAEVAPVFRLRETVDTPQAGMAGAASGAALGATVDLMTGGLTLGAAAMLGAVVGGGAAYVGAALKNRGTPTESSHVQLDEPMLGTLVETALVRYLAVIHHGRGLHPDETVIQTWRAEARALAAAQAPTLSPLWRAAREAAEHDLPLADMAAQLRTLASRVLERLYGQGA